MALSIVQHIELPENGTPPTTPTSEKEPSIKATNRVTEKALKDVRRAEQLIEEILLVADELASRQDLKPCSRVNDLFGRLVSTCIKPWNKTVVETVLGDREIEGVVGRLREMCGEGEGELERYWAERFLEELGQTASDTSIEDPAQILGMQPPFDRQVEEKGSDKQNSSANPLSPISLSQKLHRPSKPRAIKHPRRSLPRTTTDAPIAITISIASRNNNNLIPPINSIYRLRSSTIYILPLRRRSSKRKNNKYRS